jgi:hypothetical protein
MSAKMVASKGDSEFLRRYRGFRGEFCNPCQPGKAAKDTDALKLNRIPFALGDPSAFACLKCRVLPVIARYCHAITASTLNFGRICVIIFGRDKRHFGQLRFSSLSIHLNLRRTMDGKSDGKTGRKVGRTGGLRRVFDGNKPGQYQKADRLSDSCPLIASARIGSSASDLSLLVVP